MSAISTLLTRLQNTLSALRAAIWAIDVRDDIAYAIEECGQMVEQCYSDVSNPTLQTEALEAALQNKIDQGEMAALTIGDHTITAVKLANGVIPAADATLTETGKPADAAETGRQFGLIKADLDAIEPGLSDAAKAALLACFRNVGWKDNSDGMTLYNDLYNSLYDAISLQDSDLIGGSMSNSYPYVNTSDTTRLIYNGTVLALEEGTKYRIEFDFDDSKSIDVGVYLLNAEGYTKVTNHQAITSEMYEYQGWRRSGYEFIATEEHKCLWVMFRKDDGSASISTSEVRNIRLVRVESNLIINSVTHPVKLIMEGYASVHTNSRSNVSGPSVCCNPTIKTYNFENGLLNKIALNVTTAGTISLGVIKKKDAVIDEVLDFSKAHRKAVISFSSTGYQEKSFEGFVVANDEYLCCGLALDDSTFPTAYWTYGQRSNDLGYMYMQTNTMLCKGAGTSMGFDAYVEKTEYSLG